MNMNINDQDIAVSDYLKAIGVKYRAIPIQQDVIGEGGWKHDKWVVMFNSESFEYSMGIGHSVAIFTQKQRNDLKKYLAVVGYVDKLPQTKRLKRNPNKHSIVFETYELALPPTQASVLYSLLLDSSAAEMPFVDWCDDYGYNTDSRAALAIYEACQINFVKLRNVFNTKQRKHLTELLEDY
jgi:hypothetical protein